MCPASRTLAEGNTRGGSTTVLPLQGQARCRSTSKTAIATLVGAGFWVVPPLFRRAPDPVSRILGWFRP